MIGNPPKSNSQRTLLNPLLARGRDRLETSCCKAPQTVDNFHLLLARGRDRLETKLSLLCCLSTNGDLLLARGRDRLETQGCKLELALAESPLLARGRDRLETMMHEYRTC